MQCYISNNIMMIATMCSIPYKRVCSIIVIECSVMMIATMCSKRVCSIIVIESDTLCINNKDSVDSCW